jgi:hypothetical protein
MIIETIVVAVLSWIVERILDLINKDINSINHNYYKAETSYEVVIKSYT